MMWPPPDKLDNDRLLAEILYPSCLANAEACENEILSRMTTTRHKPQSQLNDVELLLRGLDNKTLLELAKQSKKNILHILRPEVFQTVVNEILIRCSIFC